MDFLFLNNPLRKIYIEMIESEWRLQNRLGEFFSVEGVLKEHEFVAGRFESLVIAACTRQNFYRAVSGIRSIWEDGLIDAGLIVVRDGDGIRPLGLLDSDP
jgi:hypothetical protein